VGTLETVFFQSKIVSSGGYNDSGNIFHIFQVVGAVGRW